MTEKYFDKLSSILLSDERLVVEEALDKNKAAELARKYDAKLLESLQTDKEIKKLFFTEIGVNQIFKKDIFLQFLGNKEFLPDSYTAYKAKIGLATAPDNYLAENSEVVLNWPYKDTVLEGGQDKEDQKRNEVFFNEVLAQDQINRLLDDKVFTNWKRYDNDGKKSLEKLEDNDNLIIKGNNLVVLHSLLKRFAGKVKLIYIDPPYNTGNDGFNYNDRFNHSTWLTFMKNRLEVAKKLLADDGVIFINLDYRESSHTRLLCDEVFKPENYRNKIIWKYATSGAYPNELAKNYDEILIYSKNPDAKCITNFKIFDENDYAKKVVSGAKIIEENDEKYYIYNGDKRTFYKQLTEVWVDIDKIKRDGKEKLKVDEKNFSGQKPEALIERILNISTNEGDIVLDYHLGSGTTAAVAHKMKRQYIGVEQMNYIEDVAIDRLEKVINGDQTGISKSVGWTGGGSFVYCNIKNDANTFREKVEGAKSDEMGKLLSEVGKSSFLSYRVDPKKLNEKEFKRLSFAEQKNVLKELVDNNTLYVNYSDIADGAYNASDDDKKFNKEFYGE